MAAVRRDSVRYYSPDRIDWFREAQEFGNEINKLKPMETTTAWLRLIAANPVTYLRHRLAVFGWMIWSPEIWKCFPLYVGIGGHDELIAKLELPRRYEPHDRALVAYASKFVETPLFRHGFFLAIAALLAVFLRVRHGPTASIPAVALLVAGIAFTLSWFVVGVSCDVRYMYFLPLCVFLAVIMLSILEAERAAERSAQSPHPAVP
jgi:hypothetical protein